MIKPTGWRFPRRLPSLVVEVVYIAYTDVDESVTQSVVLVEKNKRRAGIGIGIGREERREEKRREERREKRDERREERRETREEKRREEKRREKEKERPTVLH